MKRLTRIFQALLGVVALIFNSLVSLGRLAWRTIRRWFSGGSKGWRQVVCALLLLLLSAYVILDVYYRIESRWGRRYWNDKELSQWVEARGFGDDTFRVYNSELECYTTPRLSWVSTASDNDTLAVYALPNRRGFINVNTGRIAIDAKANDYRKAWVFSEGLAAVMKEGKVGFIDAQNQVVIPFHFDYSDKCRMWDLGYLFHDGLCVMTNAEGSLGLIDKSGRWVVEPIYDEVWAPHTSGFRVVIVGGKFGVLDAQCNVVYPTEYDYIDIVHDGFVLVRNGSMWQVDFQGRTVHAFLFDNTGELRYPVEDHEFGDENYVLSNYVKYEVMGNYGIIDRTNGRVITPAIYSDIYMLSERLFEVRRVGSNEWYLLDGRGNEVER